MYHLLRRKDRLRGDTMRTPDLLFEVQSKNQALSCLRTGLFIYEGFQAMKYAVGYEV